MFEFKMCHDSFSNIFDLGLFRIYMVLWPFVDSVYTFTSIMIEPEVPQIPRALVRSKHFPMLICVMQQLTESPVSNLIIILYFHKIGLNYYGVLQVHIRYALTECSMNEVNIVCVEYVMHILKSRWPFYRFSFHEWNISVIHNFGVNSYR